MSLDRSWFSCLCKYTKKLIVTQEVKSGKRGSFFIQILVKSLYDLFQVLNHQDESLTLPALETGIHYNGLQQSVLHDTPPILINKGIFIPLGLHFSYNIFTVEYWLEISPHLLHFEPKFNCFLKSEKCVPPNDYLLFHKLNVRGRTN